jgi:hypothetical protein
MTTVSPGWAKAHIEITSRDGVTYKVNLIDHGHHPLEGNLKIDCPPRELTPEETNYSTFRQFAPGPHTFVDLHLTGLLDGEVTREAAVLDQPNG